jgi:hypothetical protein
VHRFSNNIFYVFLISPMHATCYVLPILSSLVWSSQSTNCQAPQNAIFSTHTHAKYVISSFQALNLRGSQPNLSTRNSEINNNQFWVVSLWLVVEVLTLWHQSSSK